MRDKVYPLDIRRCEPGCDLGGVWLYSQGHHPPEAFLKAAECELEGELGDQRQGRVSRPAHLWARYEVGWDSCGEPGQIMVLHAQHRGRGCFPVTLVVVGGAAERELEELVGEKEGGDDRAPAPV